jgi:putative endonuclease
LKPSSPSDLVQHGRAEEARAAEHLLEQGYTIVTRRYKVKRGEIDLICLDEDVLVFVEVKARRAKGYLPEEAVGSEKAQALQRAGEEYRRVMGDRRPFRFDLICIDRNGLRHHENFLAND